ncbi:MAG: hypothetical protein KKE17_03160 [Proteobacteria bacterium]|nr:hypothetical protein [Pseudomonadota bacterium]MBU1708982.1 hypothetical protein [Pseudomonadota bacterium]
MKECYSLTVRFVFRVYLFVVPLLLMQFSAAPVAAAAETSGFDVLILNSYHSGYSWSDAIMIGIREGFAERVFSITKRGIK